MFKKYYFVSLVEKDMTKSFIRWKEIVRAKNPFDALEIAEGNARNYKESYKKLEWRLFSIRKI